MAHDPPNLCSTSVPRSDKDEIEESERLIPKIAGLRDFSSSSSSSLVSADDDADAALPNSAAQRLMHPHKTCHRTWKDAINAMAACALYLLIGPSLILVNRTLLKDKNFNYPMTVSSLGLLFSATVSFLLVLFRCVQLERRELVDAHFFVRNLLPIGAAMACTLAAGNAVYLYLPVSFIQMLKAFTPSVTLTMLYMTDVEIPSRPEVLSVLVICMGTAIASVGEGSFHFLGLVLMFLAEVSEAVRLVLAQKLLKNLKFGIIEGQYFMAPVSALWLCSASALVELPRAMHSKHAWDIVRGETALLLLSATLGFAVNIATFLVIKSTNSVTLKVLGTARNAGLVLVSSWLYNESITALEAVGYLVSLSAFGAYNYLKMV